MISIGKSPNYYPAKLELSSTGMVHEETLQGAVLQRWSQCHSLPRGALDALDDPTEPVLWGRQSYGIRSYSYLGVFGIDLSLVTTIVCKY